MKRLLALILSFVLLTTLTPMLAMADGEKQSGAFTYKIKGNGTAAITGYDWSSMKGQDIYIPRMLDGYMVTEIGKEAFTRLQYDGNGVIKPSFHAEAGSLVIPDTVVSIGEKAFMNTKFNTKIIKIPASVEYIGAGAFSNCSCEQFVVDTKNPIYATINGALYNKKKKELVAFPAAFTMTETNGIKYANGTYFLSIPYGIVGIGDYAMFGLGITRDMHQVLEYSLPLTLEYIGDYAFAYARPGWGTAFSLGKSVSEIGKGAFYMAVSGIWYMFLENTLISEIPDLAFYGAQLGGTIKFPQSMTSIGEKAFAFARVGAGTTGDSYEVFPSSVKTIGKEAFLQSSFAHEFVFSDGAALVSIGDSAFEGCRISNFDGKLTLPNGVESIGKKAFYNIEELTWIVLPENVEEIGANMCNRSTVSLDVVPGSYAALWASENGYSTYQPGNDDTSWLN